MASEDARVPEGLEQAIRDKVREAAGLLEARSQLEDFVGRTVFTPRGEPNTILRVEDDAVIVATRRSPEGQPVPIEDVQTGFDLLARDLVVEVKPETLGYRSSFVGAFLAYIWGEDTVLEDPYRIALLPAEPSADDEVPSERRRSPVQGRSSDVLLNQAVERKAVEEATKHWESQGWDVEDVGAIESYDLRCTMDDTELHVEVKGTSTLGSKVILPKNEVKHAREYPYVALFILQEIEVDRSGDVPVASGGNPIVYDPWNIDAGELECDRYSYTPPAAG